jgi:ABC-type glycerol-3-phosphate transport system substrate-binding protein
MAYGLRGAAVATAVAMACIGSAAAQDVKLPGTLTVTAYETGSNTFNQAVAVGQMLKNKYGTDLRVLPADNNVARQKVLTEAWAAYLKANPPDDKDAFRKGWMEVRRTALTKAGEPVGFDE